jgi:AcrR family transcriptional regulator
MSDAAGTRRGPYRKGLQRRQRIIETAVEVFAERGYTSGSMREIAARVGLTQPGLLHHFSGKEELLTEVIRARDHSVAEAIAAEQAQGLAEAILAVARHNRTERGLTSVFTVLSAEATSTEHPAHDYFTTRYRDQAASTTDNVRAEQEAGHIRDDLPPQVITAMLIAMLDGLQLQQAYLPGNDPVTTLRAFVELLSPPTPAPADASEQT